MGPMMSRGEGATSRMRSTRSKYGAIAAGENSSVPISSHQRSSTHGGVRKHVPPLIAVEPPTSRPMKMGIGAFPTENAPR